MLRWPTQEQLNKLPKLIHEKFYKAQEVYAKIETFSDGTIYIGFSDIPAEEIRAELKKLGFKYEQNKWKGNAEPTAIQKLMSTKITEEEYFWGKLKASQNRRNKING